MILFKYVKSDGFNIIKDLRIRVSSPKDFNDSFEWLPVVINVPPEQVYSDVFNNEEYLQHLYNIAISEGKTNKSFELFVGEINNLDGRAVILKNMEKKYLRPFSF